MGKMKSGQYTHASKLPNGQTYDRVLIIGPGHDKDFVKKTEEKCKKNGLSYCIIGDGERPLEKGEITGKLQGKIGPGTRVIIYAHGSIVGKEQHIRLINECSHRTSVVFQALNNCYSAVLGKESGLVVTLNSCYAGAAARKVAALPQGSMLIAESSRYHESWRVMDEASISRSLDYPKDKDRFWVAGNAFLHSPETVTISVNTDNTEEGVKKRTFRAPKEVLIQPQSIKAYLDDKLEKYKTWVEKHKGQFFSNARVPETLGTLQPPKEKTVLLTYSSNIAVIKITHTKEKEKYLEEYLNKKRPEEAECNSLLAYAIKGEVAPGTEEFLLKWMYDHGQDIAPYILTNAIETGKLGVVDSLLNTYRVDPNARQNRHTDKLPLIIAVEEGKTDIAGTLLSHKKIKVNEPDPKTGKTALHIAVEKGDKETVVKLLNHGANPKVKDKHGLMPVDYAGENPSIRQELEVAEHVRIARPSLKERLVHAPRSFVDRLRGRQDSSSIER